MALFAATCRSLRASRVALLLALLAGLLALTCASADAEPSADAADAPAKDAPAAEPLPDDATLLHMKVKELKELLARKGAVAECVACTSKREYVDRIHETADWPDVTPEPTADTPSEEELKNMFNKQGDIEDLKRKLKEAGIDTANIFKAGDLNADELEKRFKKVDLEGGAQGGGAAGKDAGDAAAGSGAADSGTDAGAEDVGDVKEDL